MSTFPSLLSLPAELRNAIYELALTSDEALYLQTVATDSKRFGALNVAPPTEKNLGDSIEYNQLNSYVASCMQKPPDLN